MPPALVWSRALEERQSRCHVLAERSAESVLTDEGLSGQGESPAEVAQTMSLSESVQAEPAAAWAHSVLRWLMTDREGSSWRQT